MGSCVSIFPKINLILFMYGINSEICFLNINIKNINQQKTNTFVEVISFISSIINKYFLSLNIIQRAWL